MPWNGTEKGFVIGQRDGGPPHSRHVGLPFLGALSKKLWSEARDCEMFRGVMSHDRNRYPTA